MDIDKRKSIIMLGIAYLFNTVCKDNNMTLSIKIAHDICNDLARLSLFKNGMLVNETEKKRMRDFPSVQEFFLDKNKYIGKLMNLKFENANVEVEEIAMLFKECIDYINNM